MTRGHQVGVGVAGGDPDGDGVRAGDRARPVPVTVAGAPARFGRAVERTALALVVVGVLLAWALAPTYPNYDTYFHLVWGRELLDGMRPGFESYAAPTEHPLWVLVAALLGLAGEHADRLVVLVCFLSYGALLLGAYRLGAAVFGRWSGLLGAVFVASSASFMLYAVRGYVDMPFLALVAWAGASEAGAGPDRQRPRTPIVLLVLAGLLRPEAWILAGLLWLWRVRGAGLTQRLWLTAAVLAAPAGWALTDLWVTGDPLWSLHATGALADALGREQGLSRVPGAFISFVGATVRPPVFALAVVGAALAVRRLGLRSARVPLALAVAGVATFVGTGVLGLSILPRYLTVPSVAFCVLAGYALVGFTTLPAGSAARRTWRRVSTGAALAGAVVLVVLAPTLSNVTSELRFIRTTHAELVRTLDAPAVRAGMRCGPLTLPNYRLVPDARWYLDAPSSAVLARSDGAAGSAARTGVGLTVVGAKPLRRYGWADGAPRSTATLGREFTPVAREGMFVAGVRCGG